MTDLIRQAQEILAGHAVLDDDFWGAWREVLMAQGDDDGLPDVAEVRELAGIVARLHEDGYTGREWLTGAALDASLCPLHWVDYAICFDDADPECVAVRAVHPVHDT